MKTHAHPCASALGRLCCALLAVLLLCAGCGQSSVSSSVDSSATSGSTSSAEQQEPDVQDWRPEQAITVLSSVQSASVPSMADLGNGQALCCWTEYAEEEERIYTTVGILDLAEDALVKTASTNQYLELKRVFSDGTALLLSYERECFYLLDAELHFSRVDVPAVDGAFSQDYSRYYYVQDSSLYTMDVATGESGRVALNQGLRVSSLDSVHPDRDYLTCWVYVSLYDWSQNMAVVDAQTGELLLLDPDMCSVAFMDEQFFCYEWNSEIQTDELLFGALRGDDPVYRFTFFPDVEETGYRSIAVLSGSNYVLSTLTTEWTDDEAAQPIASTTTIYRAEESGEMLACTLDEDSLPGTLDSAVYLSDTGLILVSVYADDGCSLVLIDPTALEFVSQGQAGSVDAAERIDSEVMDAYLAELTVAELPSDMETVRAQADVLEDAYGVHILLGEQCTTPCAASGYQVTTTDQAGLSYETATVALALADLEEALSLYPEDFFRQFCTDAEEDGLYFMLTGPIGSDNSFTVAAFEFGVGEREYIGADITDGSYDLTRNLCHEIWHAMENYIFYNSDFFGFYDGSWDACNPEDFSYLYSYADYGAVDTASLSRYLYFGTAEEVCFVDDYSLTYDKEDRARIMEYIMADDAIAEELMEYPAIREKLRIMCEGVLAAFDTTGWTDVRWERFFQDAD